MPISSRALRRIGAIFSSLVHCRRIMPTVPDADLVKAGIEAQRSPPRAKDQPLADVAVQDDMYGKGQHVR